MPTDNPLYCTGLHSIWDPKQKKIMLTLRDAIPTKAFLDLSEIFICILL